ncbi:MAG: pitrilysin family protein [Bacteroidota bacterium]
MKKIISLIIITFISFGINAQIDRSTEPKSGPAPEINLPKAEMWQLKNGLKVILVENHKLPTVSYTLHFDYDPILEGEKAGETMIFGSMMSSGTTNKSKEELFEEVETMGATLSTSRNGINVSTLKKNYIQAFEIMSDVLFNPSFPQEEFDKEIKQTLTGLEANEKDNKAVMGNVKNAVLFGLDHPYGEVMTPETAKNITLDDVKNLYNTYFKPNIAYLVVNGDIKKKELKKLVKKHLKNWKSGEVPSHIYELPQNPEKTEINFVNMDAATQSIISIVNLEELKKTNQDYFAASAGNTILGGGMTGRLFSNIREDKGWTYGAYSSLGNDKIIANFYAGASVRNSVTDSAIVEFFNEINKIQQETVNEDELTQQKNMMFGSFARTLESPATIAGFYLSEQKDNLPEGYYANYLKKVNEVTTEDVKAAMNHYLKPNNSRIVIVGKAVEVVPRLKRLGYEIKYFDIYGNPTEAPSLAKPVPADVTVSTVLDNYAQAIGGREKLEKVKTLNQDFTMQMGPYSIDGNIKTMLPNKMLMEMKMQGNVISKNVFDGEKGYVMAQGQKMPFDKAKNDKAKNSRSIFEWMDFANESHEAVLENIVPVNDSEAYKMKIVIEGETSYYYFDTKTGLILQQESIKEVQGNIITELTELKDYKEIEGIKFPTLLKIQAGPQAMEMKIKSVQINKGVKKADFK